jgi:DNA repair exonuclease SbcCD ATPase subunit
MGDERGADAVPADLPPDLASWLDDRAAESGLDSAELLQRLAEAYRAVDTDGTADSFATTKDIAELQSTIEALEDELDEKVSDVRERVIQVKREADSKAVADHGHDPLETRLDELTESIESVEAVVDQVGALDRQLEAVADRVDDVQSDLVDIEERIETGFENYETVVEDLLDRMDRVEGRVETLAQTTSTLQKGLSDARARAEAKAQVDAIKREANRLGISVAECEDCGSELQVALLTEPACPACGETFGGVEKRANFLSSHTLSTGSPPALEAGDAERVDVGQDVVSDRGSGGSP